MKSQLPEIKPVNILFYTIEELAEYCRRAVYDFRISTYTGELTKHFHGTHVNIHNFSDNSIDVTYYGRRLKFYYKYNYLTDSLTLVHISTS